MPFANETFALCRYVIWFNYWRAKSSGNIFSSRVKNIIFLTINDQLSKIQLTIISPWFVFLCILWFPVALHSGLPVCDYNSHNKHNKRAPSRGTWALGHCACKITSGGIVPRSQLKWIWRPLTRQSIRTCESIMTGIPFFLREKNTHTIVKGRPLDPCRYSALS